MNKSTTYRVFHQSGKFNSEKFGRYSILRQNTNRATPVLDKAHEPVTRVEKKFRNKWFATFQKITPEMMKGDKAPLMAQKAAQMELGGNTVNFDDGGGYASIGLDDSWSSKKLDRIMEILSSHTEHSLWPTTMGQVQAFLYFGLTIDLYCIADEPETHYLESLYNLTHELFA
jgi:hypothetical protein